MLDPAVSGRYPGSTVLVTGHTGFLGNWLVRWLNSLGATIVGYSRGRRQPDITAPPGTTTIHGEITDQERLAATMADHRPDLVFHLAAQAVVPIALRDPVRTVQHNVLGTAAILDAAVRATSVRGVVIIGTPATAGPPNGSPPDPYAASKLAAEAIAAAYSHPALREQATRQAPLSVATARPGVMVGGDSTPGRLLPDIVQAVERGQPVSLRRPGATRPWQHVLDGASGIILLGARMLSGSVGLDRYHCYDFGRADPASAEPARTVASQFLAALGVPDWPVQGHEGPADHMSLGCTAAQAELGWQPRWDLHDTLSAAARWYLAPSRPGDKAQVTDQLIARFAAGQPP